MTKLRRNRLIFFPVFFLSLVVFVLGIQHVWQGDAIAFSYFMPRFNEDSVFIPFNNIGEIIPSMANHFMHSTGRVFTHAMAQFFCAFAGKYVFSVVNAFMWGAFAVMLIKLSGIRNPGFLISSCAVLLTFLIFFSYGNPESIPFEPPHQIDYVWCGVFNMIWINLLFKKNISKKSFIPLIIFSFVLGFGNESFSIPICGAILILLLLGKIFNRKKIYLCVAYGIGTIIMILAPGNINRFFSDTEGFNLFYMIENLLPGLTLPLLLFCVYWVSCSFCKRRLSYHKINSEDWFFLYVIVLTFCMSIVLGVKSGTRMLTCANMLLAVLILRRISFLYIITNKSILIRTTILIISYLSFSILVLARENEILKFNERNIEISRQYRSSSNGVVTLKDEDYLYNTNSILQRPNLFGLEEKVRYPHKDMIKIRPRSFNDLPIYKDTNICIEIAPQAWLMLQSKAKPAEFVIHKTISASFINKNLGDRVVDFARKEILIDSTEYGVVGIYHNNRPYIRANIEVRQQD